MVKRNPISAQQNLWSDAELVDNDDLSLEQVYNNTIQSGVVGNQIGSGVVLEDLQQNIIFDSLLSTGFLDGKIIASQAQPSDNNLGNQLAIELSNSLVAGKKDIKIGIIGLDFQGNLQYETFVFKTNETQLTKKHFTNILLLLFNDFFGNPSLSFNLGGRIIIREVKPLEISKSTVMVSQEVEPNLFFRDFFLDGFISLQALLQTALPLYDIDTLNINTSPVDNQALLANDVSTQIGQKFLATTNNIQKITLLLSVRNTVVGQETNLNWSGDLIVSVYPLQSIIDCPSDIAPNLPIQFSPSNIPLAQITINYSSLHDSGTILDSVPQPVDFVFSNTSIAVNKIIPGQFYAVAAKRAGTAGTCDILFAFGTDSVENSRVTVFNNGLWVDLPEEDLWFKIWTDAAKIADGQAYENGLGIVIPKTYEDPITLSTIDNVVGDLSFTGNNIFSAVVQAITQPSNPIPDQRTGEPVFSIQQFVPQITLLNDIDLANLRGASDPLVVGVISDKNKKTFNPLSLTINSKIHSATVVNNELLLRIVDDATDGYRFDTSVSGLASNLLNGDFSGAILTPDGYNTSISYRVAKSSLCSMIVGDVDGNGIIDDNDLILFNQYLNFNLNVEPPLNTSITLIDGYHTTFINGYTTYTQNFANLFGASFQIVDTSTNTIIVSGSDGTLIANPLDNTLAQFSSTTVNFTTIPNLTNYKLVVLTSSIAGDHGGFTITNLDVVTKVITIKKIILTGDVIGQMFRADIDGDFYISNNDGYLLQSYIDRLPLPSPPPSPFPGPISNSYLKIGTTFNVLRLTLEEFIDRADDYASDPLHRNSTVHTAQDIFINDSANFANHDYDFGLKPISFTIKKQLFWDESFVVVNSIPKAVPVIFPETTGYSFNTCLVNGVNCTVYPPSLSFDPGKNDAFVPNDLILGNGDLKRPDGSFYKVDFEVGNIVLEMPVSLDGYEKTINLLDDFIVDYNGNGITKLGYPAMRFADCSTVSNTALLNNQIRFNVSAQAFSPQLNGLSFDGYSGIIVDGKIGVSMDYATGLLTLNFSNLYQDAVQLTLSTKIQVIVYLKRGGFNNTPLFVNSTQTENLLNSII
jgi:hypothetical protein